VWRFIPLRDHKDKTYLKYMKEFTENKRKRLMCNRQILEGYLFCKPSWVCELDHGWPIKYSHLVPIWKAEEAMPEGTGKRPTRYNMMFGRKGDFHYVYATQDIAKGEEICIYYGEHPNADRWPRGYKIRLPQPNEGPSAALLATDVGWPSMEEAMATQRIINTHCTIENHTDWKRAERKWLLRETRRERSKSPSRSRSSSPTVIDLTEE